MTSDSTSPAMGLRNCPRALAFLFVVLGSPMVALAQEGGPPTPLDHWSFELLEVLDAAGVAHAWMTGVRPTSRATVRNELARVVERGFGPDRAHPTISAWSSRFQREYPVSAAEDGGLRLEASLSGGLREGEAFLDPGGGVFGEVAVAATLASHMSTWASFDSGGRDIFDGFRELGASVPAGPFTVMVGRQPLKAAGPAETSAQLGGTVPFDALYVVSARPAPLPFFDWLFGPISWQFGLAPWAGIRDTSEGWVGVGAAIAQPTSWLRLGAARVARFGGSDTDPVSFKRIFKLVFLDQNEPTNWDDQKLELSARARWSLFGQRLASYVVLAQEDSPLWKNPGILLGTSVPILATSGIYSFGYEYTAYGRRARWCPGCEYARGRDGSRFQAEWYDHGRLGFFARDGVPVGDPLGGYGANHKASIRFWSPGGGVRAKAWVFFELREDGNLLMTRWPANRRGGGAQIAWEVVHGIEADATLVGAGGPALESEWGVSLRLTARAPRIR